MAVQFICVDCKRTVCMNNSSKMRDGRCFGCHIKEKDRIKKEELKNKAAEELVR